MALTKIGKEGITGVSNAANATFLTATSAEGVTLAGTLAVTGVHTVGTNAVATSDGGAVTTSVIQGLAKCWVQTPSGGTAADSFNVSGMTDNSTGNYTVAIANNMANDDYSVTISKIVGGSNRDANAESVATSNFIIVSTAASAMEDQTCFGTIHGDLA